MKRQAWAFATVVAACALALGACSKQADTNPNAPGSPGSTNSSEVVRPAAPDGPPGGPSGIVGSAPHTGSSGGDVLPGTTGSGTDETSGRSQAAQTGTGLNGGLGGSNSVMGAAPATDAPVTSAPSGSGPGSTAGGSGSSNATPGSAVGGR
jgi:hypothetical protein